MGVSTKTLYVFISQLALSHYSGFQNDRQDKKYEKTWYINFLCDIIAFLILTFIVL